MPVESADRGGGVAVGAVEHVLPVAKRIVVAEDGLPPVGAGGEVLTAGAQVTPAARAASSVFCGSAIPLPSVRTTAPVAFRLWCGATGASCGCARPARERPPTTAVSVAHRGIAYGLGSLWLTQGMTPNQTAAPAPGD